MSRFDKTAVRRWRRTAFREVQSLGCKPSEPIFSAAIVMFAIYGFGTDTSVLVEVTGLSDVFVMKIVRRLRRSRVLIGQTLRVRWDAEGLEGVVAAACDALVAVGQVDRPVDPKRSAAQKAVATQRNRGVPRRRVIVAPGSVFSPKVVKSNPLYQIHKDEGGA